MASLDLRDADQSNEALIDELVQAHLDTIEMVEEWLGDPSWDSHSEYLKGLVRYAKRLTAARAAGGASPLGWQG
jgi:hypothetical protein